jgi:hypothetical protein
MLMYVAVYIFVGLLAGVCLEQNLRQRKAWDSVSFLLILLTWPLLIWIGIRAYINWRKNNPL